MVAEPQYKYNISTFRDKIMSKVSWKMTRWGKCICGNKVKLEILYAQQKFWRKGTVEYNYYYNPYTETKGSIIITEEVCSV